LSNGPILRKAVMWTSIVIALASFGYAGFLRASHEPIPLWNKALMAYGGVFCVFLFFDEVGRSFAKHRQERSVELHRPRPTPSRHPGQRVAVAPSADLAHSEIRLERVSTDTLEPFQKMVTAFYTETLALEGKRPNVDAEGHLVDVPVSQWLTARACHPFLLMHNEQPFGCCVLQTEASVQELVLLYIEPSLRRRHGGAAALEKVEAFVRLLGANDAIVANVSRSNMRGQNFLRACGFRPAFDEGDGVETVLYRKSLNEG
jgi:GNAT superfamily N-acetyltransferase